MLRLYGIWDGQKFAVYTGRIDSPEQPAERLQKGTPEADDRAAIYDTGRWFGELDRFNSEPFMENVRGQPVTPRREFSD